MIPRNPTVGDATAPSGAHPQEFAVPLPGDAVPLAGLRADATAHALGYFRSERFVLFGYCPGGGEVVWKDGHSAGFGTGGWQTFLDQVAPLAARRGISLGGPTAIGTHVLLIDRALGTVHAAPREPAEDFLARVNGVPAPTRRCLCALLHCASCPVRTCPHAGSPGRPDPHGYRGDRVQTPANAITSVGVRARKAHG
jgi:hypothetical protein